MNSLPDVVTQALEDALGPLRNSAPISGGDINDAYLVTLASGDRAFVKTHPSPPDKMYEVEARGLRWLGETGINVPEVLLVADTFLALEYLAPAPTSPASEEALGRALARIHAHEDESCAFGWHHDGFIGPLLQSNRPATDWPSFYRDRRLVPLMRLATRRGVVGKSLQAGFDTLCARLPSLLGDAAGEDRPSRLHGDLWGGNVHQATDGPYFIDPAPYWGHREVDLAMMQLFGGFSERVFAAYDEAMPRAADHEDRVPLYQLYPLLVHVCLFGATYVPGVTRVVERYT